MIEFATRIGQEWLFALDPETAHSLSINALRLGLGPAGTSHRDRRLGVRVAGLDFPNRLGIAAGYDKNAEVPDALLKLGFGFAEIGTLTPLPQSGNPRPRIFRLMRDRAVINRLGFNNEGHQRAFDRLKRRHNRPGIVGVNIGANKDSQDRIGDYEKGIERFAGTASYFTANVSSPNTPNLRALQNKDNLAELLTRVITARDKAIQSSDRSVPVFLKIAPDLGEADLDDIAEAVENSSLDGLIVSNTTLARDGLIETRHAGEAGGLSGQPLFERSTMVLAKMRRRIGKKLPIIGVGGVGSADQVLEKIRAGADLVQLYTGLIYGGPYLPRKILRGLSEFADKDGLGNLSEIRDLNVDSWADKPLG